MTNDAALEPRREPAPGPAPTTGPETSAPARIDYRAANLRGTDLSGLNLEHADLRAADLRDVNFTGSNLRYADFRGSNVSGSNFQNALLYGAKMQGVEAFGADFRKCDLRQVNFGGAYLEGSMMPPPEWTPSPGEIAGGTDPPPQEDRVWRQQIEEVENGHQDGRADNGQNQRDRGQPRHDEQRGKERGR